MFQPRSAQTATIKCLAWLLVVALALLGSVVNRQQTLGPMHSHSEPDVPNAYLLTDAFSKLTSEWSSRWEQQQLLGHGQLRLRGASDTRHSESLSLRAVHPEAGRDAHDHDALERHQHAVNDGSVVALDGAPGAVDAADSAVTAAFVLLPCLLMRTASLEVLDRADCKEPWPLEATEAFVSRVVAPPLRPPAA